MTGDDPFSEAPVPRAWPDLAGRIVDDGDGRRHELPVRVYFEDTDAGGIAYHASFIRWCERGRTDFLRLLGTDARRLIDGSASVEPAAIVVRRMACEFLRPARMDDVLLVETRVKDLGGASVTLMQTVLLGARRVFEAEVTVVLVAVSGKPLRLSAAVRSALGGDAANILGPGAGKG
jgi:acyl-CoA thioester hydrolase